MTEPTQSNANPGSAAGAMPWPLLLRWPIALVVTAVILATALARVLSQPIKIQLVMDAPFPVAGQVDVGSVRTPLLVERIENPIRTEPIVTRPIAANVTLVKGVELASPLSVSVPELGKGLGVSVRGPVEANVGGEVKALVAGRVDASVIGDVAAVLRGNVDANVNGQVDVSVPEPLKLRRIKLGL